MRHILKFLAVLVCMLPLAAYGFGSAEDVRIAKNGPVTELVPAEKVVLSTKKEVVVTADRALEARVAAMEKKFKNIKSEKELKKMIQEMLDSRVADIKADVDTKVAASKQELDKEISVSQQGRAEQASKDARQDREIAYNKKLATAAYNNSSYAWDVFKYMAIGFLIIAILFIAVGWKTTR